MKPYMNSWAETFGYPVPLEKIYEARDLTTSVLKGLTITGVFGPAWQVSGILQKYAGND